MEQRLVKEEGEGDIEKKNGREADDKDSSGIYGKIKIDVLILVRLFIYLTIGQ